MRVPELIKKCYRTERGALQAASRRWLCPHMSEQLTPGSSWARHAQANPSGSAPASSPVSSRKPPSTRRRCRKSRSGTVRRVARSRRNERRGLWWSGALRSFASTSACDAAAEAVDELDLPRPPLNRSGTQETNAFVNACRCALAAAHGIGTLPRSAPAGVSEPAIAGQAQLR